MTTICYSIPRILHLMIYLNKFFISEHTELPLTFSSSLLLLQTKLHVLIYFIHVQEYLQEGFEF